MTVYTFDPLQDGRWGAFLQAHPQASVFHTAGWLQCLRQTYGYTPLALSTSPPGAALTNAVVFCRVKSWLTGERLVSVPFADHCQPLFEQMSDFVAILEYARRSMAKRVEIRPLDDGDLELAGRTSFRPADQFRLHLLDLNRSEDELLKACDKDSVQRRIRRAIRENLTYEEGTSPDLIQRFYTLQLLTRRKHQAPPQPLEWFKNLGKFLPENMKIRMVSKGDVPVASILTLSFKKTMIYKYGCSDAAYNHLAGTPYLFWQAILDAMRQGADLFDMGRSDLDNPGLLNFKSNWGTRDLPLTYWRYPQQEKPSLLTASRGHKVGGYVVSRLPDNLLILLGKVLYKHIG